MSTTPPPRGATLLNSYRQAIIAVAHQLWDEDEPNLLVADGHPGRTQVDDIVGFGRAWSEIESGPMGPRRQREEVLNIVVLFSIFRAGGIDAEKVARDFAYDRLRELDNYVRATDTELAGLVRDCFVTSIEDAGVDPELITNGRLIEVQAIFTAHARLTTS
jgi:hypothetical protein